MATNMYIKFEGSSGGTVEGGSSATGHEKEIEMLSWNHGFSQPTSPTRSMGGSGTVEQANHQNFSFSKYIDSATNELLKACWSGDQIDKATVTCYRADEDTANAPVKYLMIEMQHVIVSNFSISGGPGDVPVENISLDYGILTYTYQSQARETGQTASSGAQPIKHDLETRKIE